jgi:CRISPR/Cas system CSM-associated protein Csm2 small subunit
MKLTDNKIRAIFHSITYGVGNHGSFLKSLAETVIRTDNENFELLKPVLEEIIKKYDLNKKPYTEID